MEFDACLDGSNSTTANFQFFIFALSLFFFPFPLVHDCITQYYLRKTKERHREREEGGGERTAYSIFGILKQVSALFLSSMFVYPSQCTELDDLRYSQFLWLDSIEEDEEEEKVNSRRNEVEKKEEMLTCALVFGQKSNITERRRKKKRGKKRKRIETDLRRKKEEERIQME